ncbi:DUF6207 family protein [Streptomyces sp. NPDC051214]|uniref:DUF6207 family protein n=1 Tax=Streptomyces sp. NPDC051214 TaxID=3155282 RepID=UPI003430EF67
MTYRPAHLPQPGLTRITVEAANEETALAVAHRLITCHNLTGASAPFRVPRQEGACMRLYGDTQARRLYRLRRSTNRPGDRPPGPVRSRSPPAGDGSRRIHPRRGEPTCSSSVHRTRTFRYAAGKYSRGWGERQQNPGTAQIDDWRQ